MLRFGLILLSIVSLYWAQSDFTVCNSAFFVTNTTVDHGHAVAYNPDQNEYLVVWIQEETGISSTSVVAQRFFANGTRAGSQIVIQPASAPGDKRSPAVAYGGKWMVAWSYDWNIETSGSASWGIVTQTIDPVTYLLGQVINDVNPSNDATSEWDKPNLLYNYQDDVYVLSSQFSPQDIVGWGPYIQLLNNDGTFQGTAQGLNIYDSYMSKTRVGWNTISNEYVLIWSSIGFSQSSRDILGQRFTNELAVRSPIRVLGATTAVNGASLNDNTPSIAFSDVTNEFALVWQGQTSLFDAGANGPSHVLVSYIAPNLTITDNAVRIASIFSDLIYLAQPEVYWSQRTDDFVLVYRYQDSSDGSFKLVSTVIDSYNPTLANTILIEVGGVTPAIPQLAYNFRSNQFMMVWDSEAIVVPTNTVLPPPPSQVTDIGPPTVSQSGNGPQTVTVTAGSSSSSSAASSAAPTSASPSSSPASSDSGTDSGTDSGSDSAGPSAVKRGWMDLDFDLDYDEPVWKSLFIDTAVAKRQTIEDDNTFALLMCGPTVPDIVWSTKTSAPPASSTPTSTSRSTSSRVGTSISARVSSSSRTVSTPITSTRINVIPTANPAGVEGNDSSKVARDTAIIVGVLVPIFVIAIAVLVGLLVYFGWWKPRIAKKLKLEQTGAELDMKELDNDA